MNDQFARLIEPVDATDFWRSYWGKKHLHLSTGNPGRHDSFLRTEDLDAFLQSEQLSAAFVNVVTGGVLHPLEEWSRVRESARGRERVVHIERLFALYMEGATIILNQAQQTVPGLSLLCRLLSVELGFATQANVYLTPPSAQGFPPHEDDHEVLVLQILGQKSWHLSPHGASSPVGVELQQGDLLYIPRGLVHHAVSGSAPSIHVSLGLKPVYAFQLLEALAEKARKHPAFQEALPPEFMRAEHESVVVDFEKNAEILLRESPVSELKERRFRSLVGDQSQSWAGRLTDLLAIGDITLDTVVCARPGILQTRENDGKSIHVEFAGHNITVPAFLESCVRMIVAPEPFAVRELQGMITDSGRIELVKRFVRTGYLSIVTLRGGSEAPQRSKPGRDGSASGQLD